MSIILDALRARDAAKSANEKTLPKEGLFFGVPEQRAPQNPTRLSFLIMVLFALTAFAVLRFGAQYFKVQPAADQVQTAAPRPLSDLTLPPPKPVIDVTSAKALFAQDRIDESLEMYEQLVKAHPNDALLQNDMGLILIKKDRLLEAEARIQSALRVDANCAECYNNLGMLSSKMGRIDDAEKYLKMATSLKAGYADPYFNLGVLFEKLGDKENAVSQYQAFLKTTSDPNSPIAIQVKDRVAKMTASSEE